MIRKIKYIVLAIIILLILSFVIYFYKSNGDYDNNVDFIKEELTEEQINMYESFNEKFYGGGAIIRLVEKNGNWNDIPLTEHFREKYNEKNGILGNITFDKVEYCPYEEGTYPFTFTSYFVITQGKKKTAYQYSEETIRNEDLMFYYFDDIILSDPIVFVDENGNELDTRLRCNKENFTDIVWKLFDMGDDASKSIAVTTSFQQKYNNIEDAISKKLLNHNTGYSVGYKSANFDDKSALYYWKSGGIRYLVNVKFITDENDYIDDIEVDFVGEG